MIRTRFAPSPTGYMHLGNLRTALYCYLIAKGTENGTFILRIEDTDQERQVEGAVDVIYNTLNLTGLVPDESPRVGGNFGPYVQSERLQSANYLGFAKQLVEMGKAYYCFCTPERLASLQSTVSGDSDAIVKYDRHCDNLTKEEIEKNLAEGKPFVIRQKIREGEVTFNDTVYGSITVETSTLDDQVLIKSDGFPTYNFANVVDDHLMNITHVVRGSEYLSSSPKYTLLYEAFGWDEPTYVHLPLMLNQEGRKLSKRHGDKSFEDLLAEGFLPEAVVNYIALLGWAPEGNEEFFTFEELKKAFSVAGISKSPSSFDPVKLKWMNGEYIKKMEPSKFAELATPYLKEEIKRTDVDLNLIASYVQSRVALVHEVKELVDNIDHIGEYENEIYCHKKMKTDEAMSLENLKAILPVIEAVEENNWNLEYLHDVIMDKIQAMEIKNGQMLWPLRTALSGRPTSPCGGIDYLIILGKEDSIKRINFGIEKLTNR